MASLTSLSDLPSFTPQALVAPESHAAPTNPGCHDVDDAEDMFDSPTAASAALDELIGGLAKEETLTARSAVEELDGDCLDDALATFATVLKVRFCLTAVKAWVCLRLPFGTYQVNNIDEVDQATAAALAEALLKKVHRFFANM